jgi:hypothetical protein
MGALKDKIPYYARDHVHRSLRSPAFRDSRASSRRTNSLADLQLAARSKVLYAVGLDDAA